MTIDKSWTQIRNRKSREFTSGLDSFIEHSKQYVNGDGDLRCPCKNCLNNDCHPLHIVHFHIGRYGFSEFYKMWIFHGEVDSPPVRNQLPPTSHEMLDVIHDLVHEQDTNEESSEEVDVDANGDFSDCEDDDAPPPPVRRRGKARGLTLAQAIAKNGGRPLSISFDTDYGTFKAIGDNAGLFTREIGNQVRAHIPPCHSSWEDVPSEDRTAILPRIQNSFDLNEHMTGNFWSRILNGIEREYADRYRDIKGRHKNHFDNVGGYEDLDAARRSKPSGLSQANWEKTVQFFLDPSFRKRSEINKQNRQKAKYPSLHGSQSYVAYRHKKAGPKTKQKPDLIDTFQEMRSRPSTAWVNDAARIDHEAMRSESLASSQAASGSQSSVNEAEIVTKVLGERRGHTRGQRRKLKNTPSQFATQSSTFQKPQQPSPDATQQMIHYLFQQNQDLIKHLNQFATNQYVPRPPPAAYVWPQKRRR